MPKLNERQIRKLGQRAAKELRAALIVYEEYSEGLRVLGLHHRAHLVDKFVNGIGELEENMYTQEDELYGR